MFLTYISEIDHDNATSSIDLPKEFGQSTMVIDVNVVYTAFPRDLVNSRH